MRARTETYLTHVLTCAYVCYNIVVCSTLCDQRSSIREKKDCAYNMHSHICTYTFMYKAVGVIQVAAFIANNDNSLCSAAANDAHATSTSINRFCIVCMCVSNCVRTHTCARRRYQPSVIWVTRRSRRCSRRPA